MQMKMKMKMKMKGMTKFSADQPDQPGIEFGPVS